MRASTTNTGIFPSTVTVMIANPFKPVIFAAWLEYMWKDTAKPYEKRV